MFYCNLGKVHDVRLAKRLDILLETILPALAILILSYDTKLGHSDFIFTEVFKIPGSYDSYRYEIKAEAQNF